MKLSLRDLESVIQAQFLYASLCLSAEGQVPDEPRSQAFHITRETYLNLITQFQSHLQSLVRKTGNRLQA